ncbi:MAG: glycosyltransferase family 2 protein [Halalkalicoccus sp.]
MTVAERNVADATAVSAGGTVRTSIVLPAYNERENVGPLIEELLETFAGPEAAPYAPIEIVVVDDGSTDGTRELLRDLAEEIGRLRVVLLRRNFGQSAALAAGIDHAMGEWIVTMDADGQNDPADVPELLSTLAEGYDCVSGWRRDRSDPLSKTVPSAIQTRLAWVTGPDIHDFGCTLKAYRADALRDIDLYGEGHRYIPAKLYKRGYRITERPVSHRERTAGETKYGWARLFKGSIDLLFHVFWNRYSTRPIHFLGTVGLLMTIIGGLIGVHAVLIRVVYGIPLSPRLPRLILVVALVLFGFQLLMFGFLAEMLTKRHYADEKTYRIERVYGREPIATEPSGRPERETE